MALKMERASSKLGASGWISSPPKAAWSSPRAEPFRVAEVMRVSYVGTFGGDAATVIAGFGIAQAPDQWRVGSSARGLRHAHPAVARSRAAGAAGALPVRCAHPHRAQRPRRLQLHPPGSGGGSRAG